MDEVQRFKDEVRENISVLQSSDEMRDLGIDFVNRTAPFNYSYNFTWMGRPIIQFPQDMIAMQEIIWDLRPELIIETGIAHGGSLIYYASLLKLLGQGRVLGIDIDIREHNRQEIEAHPVADRIDMIQGSSIDAEIIEQVAEHAKGKKSVLVILDSNHTHEHVMEELRLYAPFVTLGSYCVVFDTVVEDMPADAFPHRPWGAGDNPKTAVREFLKQSKEFEIDAAIQSKLLITVAPDGYLRRVAPKP